MDFTAARHNMVESQIRTNKVTDPAIIAAFEEIPREVFVPESLRRIAYVDEALPIGEERFLMEPLVLARLLQSAQVGSTDLALDVGCGSGYASAILSRLVSTVVALESSAALANEAGKTLSDLTIDTATIVEGPLHEGWPSQSPYDLILLGGAVEEIPSALTDQLADGGRLAGVVVENGIGRGTIVTRFGDSLSRLSVFDAGTPALPGFAAEAAFVF